MPGSPERSGHPATRPIRPPREELMRAAGITRTRGAPGQQRSEAIAGYLFIAVPMVLFLILNIGSILYAVYISVWKWNIRSGPVAFLGTKNYENALADPIFMRAIENTIYYTV